MKKNDFLMKLALYYNTKTLITNGDGEEVLNPDIEMMKIYVRDMGERELDELFNKIILKFVPTSTVKFPKLSVVRAILESEIDVKAERAWESVQKLSGFISVAFEDVRVQQIIKSMSGDMFDFTEWRDGEERTWCKKEFLRLYKMECTNPREIEREAVLGHDDILSGVLGSSHYNESGVIKQGIKYVGNPGNKENIISIVSQKAIGRGQGGVKQIGDILNSSMGENKNGGEE